MSNTIDKPAEKRVFVIYGGHNGLQPIFYSYSKTIKNCLPADEQRALSAAASTWGDEIYFAIPVKTGLENAVSVVREGDLAYWPEGSCFCIFFGKTPASTDTEIKPASPVNLVGRFSGAPELWKKVASGDTIRLEAVRD